MTAVASEFQHDLADALSIEARAPDPFADPQSLGFAPGKGQHRIGHAVIENDDVRLLQRAHRLDGQELHIAGPHVDEGHAASLRLTRRDAVDLRKQPGFRVPAGVFGKGEVDEALPEGTAPGGGGQPLCDVSAQPLRRTGPAGERFRDQHLDAAADRLCKHRRGAVGRNADHHRAAVDDGAESEVAMRRLVDDVDDHARHRVRQHGTQRPPRPRAHRQRPLCRSKSAGVHGRRSIVIALPCAAATAIISTEISSARTSTRAPQAARSSAFQAAAASPPATSASRPVSSRKTGSRASGPIRAGRRSAGFGESRNGIDMVRLVLGLAQGGLRDDPPDLGAA